jgi:predicted AAA+ superfamily ATPase
VRQTADVYREHLERLFLLDPLPAWIPAFSPLRRLTHTPKHHLVDPALAARLVGVGSEGLLRGEGVRVRAHHDAGTWLGALFESLVVQSVRIYAEAAEASVGHLRTKSTEHEIDVIVERADRSIVAMEIKLSASVDDRDVRHLTWLRGQLPDRVVDTIVVTTGEQAYRRGDGVAVIPLALLGP